MRYNNCVRLLQTLHARLPRTKEGDAMLVLSYFCGTCIYSLLFHPGVMFGHILFFIVPGLYLTIRYWRRNYHAFLFSIAAGLATGFPLQIVAELNNVWDYHFPLFDWMTFGGLRMIPLAWYVLWIGLTISAYSVFFDRHIHRVPEKHVFWRVHYRFLVLCAAVTAGSMYFLVANPDAFIFPHPYVVVGSLLFIVPTVAILFLHPQLIRDSIKAASLLALFMLVYELVGLKIGWWTYSGHYIAAIPLFGTVLPIEEIILWILFGALFCVVAYEEVEHDAEFT
jgi:hypothetical protein